MSNFLLFVAIIVFAFYFIIIRPQKREQVERERVLSTLSKGTKIVTAGGIHGTIASSAKGSDTVEIEVARGVKLTVNRASISRVDSPKEKGGAKDGDGKKDKGPVERNDSDETGDEKDAAEDAPKPRTPAPRKGKRK